MCKFRGKNTCLKRRKPSDCRDISSAQHKYTCKLIPYNRWERHELRKQYFYERYVSHLTCAVKSASHMQHMPTLWTAASLALIAWRTVRSNQKYERVRNFAPTKREVDE